MLVDFVGVHSLGDYSNSHIYCVRICATFVKIELILCKSFKKKTIPSVEVLVEVVVVSVLVVDVVDEVIRVVVGDIVTIKVVESGFVSTVLEVLDVVLDVVDAVLVVDVVVEEVVEEVVISVHVKPSPVNPSAQAQSKDPTLFEQTAFSAHVSLPAAHSSMSLQVTPSPVKPALLKEPPQTQSKEPNLFVHSARGEQLSSSASHSSISVQKTPSPSKPGLHAQSKEPKNYHLQLGLQCARYLYSVLKLCKLKFRELTFSIRTKGMICTVIQHEGALVDILTSRTIKTFIART